MEPVRTDVLIVGAGPSGLTLACALARAGVGFHLVDKLAARSPHSRALVLHQRSLEIFSQLGIADGLIAQGNAGNRGRFHVGRKLKAEVRFFDEAYAGCRFRSALFIEQDRTERALDACLEALGHRPHLGHELAEFRETTDGVTARCKGPDGEYAVECRYIAGCDGAHSAVRHHAGIAFKGAAYAQDFMLADVTIDWDQPRDSFMVFVDRQGFLAVFPMRDKFRLVSVRGKFQDNAPEPSLDDFRELMQRLVPYPATISDPTWLARFHLHHRIARRFARGRVVLAGDAAHIHSPVGGQGMNTGIQDAWNLGWKLAWSLMSPACAEALLQSYHEERYPVGKMLLRTTDTAFTFVSGQRLLPRIVRSCVMPWLIPLGAGLRGLQRHGMFRISQLGIGYRGSRLCGPGRGPFTRALKPGDRMPDFEIGGVPLHTLLDPLRPTLLAVGVDAPDSPMWKVVSLPEPSPTQRRLLGMKTSGCLLIRPDAHLAARARTPEALKGSKLGRLAQACFHGS